MADEINTNPQEVQAAVDAALNEQKKKKKKKRLIVLAVILAFVIGIIAIGGSGDSENVGDHGAGTETTENANKVDYQVSEGFAEVWTDSINSKWIRIAVPVKNTGNVNLYLSSSSFDVENKDGEIVDTIDFVSVYPQVLKPGETAYYYEETLYEGKDVKELKVVGEVEAEKATVDCVRYAISEDKVKTDEYGETKLLGRVENVTDLDGSDVYIAVNFFDKDGNFLVQQFDVLENDLKAGAKKGFQTVCDSYDLKASDVGSYEVYAFPYQYQF